jgi:hypothetical protein
LYDFVRYLQPRNNLEFGIVSGTRMSPEIADQFTLEAAGGMGGGEGVDDVCGGRVVAGLVPATPIGLAVRLQRVRQRCTSEFEAAKTSPATTLMMIQDRWEPL